jgi:hypothetical protein
MKTTQLLLTTTAQLVKTVDFCTQVIIRESRSTVGWPTVQLGLQNPTTADYLTPYQAGEPVIFQAPPGERYPPKYPLGWVSLISGAVNGTQDEK